MNILIIIAVIFAIIITIYLITKKKKNKTKSNTTPTSPAKKPSQNVLEDAWVDYFINIHPKGSITPNQQDIIDTNVSDGILPPTSEK